MSRALASRNSSSVACQFDATAASTWNGPASGSSKTSTRGARAASREATRASGFTCCAGSGLAAMLRMIVHHDTSTAKRNQRRDLLAGWPRQRDQRSMQTLGRSQSVETDRTWRNSKRLNDRELSLLITACLEEAKRRGTLAPRHQTNVPKPSATTANLCLGASRAGRSA
jgi:hypothetical protein